MNINERTFQGEFYRIINKILNENDEIKFHKITQEENVGIKGQVRFADGKLYSNIDSRKIISFELKDTKWDATDEVLVMDAMRKAFNNGYEYFVTGTPRQLAIYCTFKPNTQATDRKLKIYTISTVKNNELILLPTYEKEITPKLVIFLKEISDLVHGTKEVHWDSIDRFFVNKLSAYILEASAEMVLPMYEKIHKDKDIRGDLKNYLKNQDIFNMNYSFDFEDVYKICQLTNYFLYLKIIFYSYLLREVPELRLKPLEIPIDNKMINLKLRERFNDVLKHDYQLIFEENILDRFEFEDKYIPMFKDNIEQISKLKFSDLNADIMGAIYNTLIDNQEQHHRGQHFTNTNEVDIINCFCINSKTKNVLDSGCGAGTFLVRAYMLFKHFDSSLTHQQLLEKIWGVEIAAFPAFLSAMNLSLLDIKTFDNYPIIIHNDFSEIKTNYTYSGMFLNVNNEYKINNLGNKKAEVIIPTFDSCIGNPPYIRQEYIEKKEKWNNLINIEIGIKKINQQSDLYVYYLMHSTAFLIEGGRLGYVISSSWLDVSFGAGLQNFLLNHFKIIAIIDNQKIRSFETASINTVILIIEKCSEIDVREKNYVKFVRINCEYEKLIGRNNDNNRFKKVIELTSIIENSEQNYSNPDIIIQSINQKQLENLSTIDNLYKNGHWGTYFLRSPGIFNKIIQKADNKLIPLSTMVDVIYGIKTGANGFFYLVDETEKAKKLDPEEYKLTFGISKEKHLHIWSSSGWYYSALTNRHFIIEKEYIKPVFKKQSEAINLDVNISCLKYNVIICNQNKIKLSKQKKSILKYIELGESKQFEIHKRPSCQNGENWYDISSRAVVGDFIFPAKIGEKFRLIDNRESQVFCDKVNYVFKVKEEFKQFSDILFLILNSITFRYFIDLFSRQLTGNQTLSDVDVNVVSDLLIINPILLKDKGKELNQIYISLKNREQESIHEEILKSDKIKLDNIIFETLGLSISDVEELYNVASKFVKDRQEKSESVITSKSKQRLTYDQAVSLINDRFPEISKYKDIIKNYSTRVIEIPNWKAIYSKEASNSDNLFGIYDVYFQQGNSQRTLTFDNFNQVTLFKYLNSELEVKGIKIDLPISEMDCADILKIMKEDFNEFAFQIKSFLKSNRSNANYLSIYRDLLFSK